MPSEKKTPSLREEKRRAISIASQLGYISRIPYLESRLKNAKNTDEISVIMCKARKAYHF